MILLLLLLTVSVKARTPTISFAPPYNSIIYGTISRKMLNKRRSMQIQEASTLVRALCRLLIRRALARHV